MSEVKPTIHFTEHERHLVAQWQETQRIVKNYNAEWALKKDSGPAREARLNHFKAALTFPLGSKVDVIRALRIERSRNFKHFGVFELDLVLDMKADEFNESIKHGMDWYTHKETQSTFFRDMHRRAESVVAQHSLTHLWENNRIVLDTIIVGAGIAPYPKNWDAIAFYLTVACPKLFFEWGEVFAIHDALKNPKKRKLFSEKTKEVDDHWLKYSNRVGVEVDSFATRIESNLEMALQQLTTPRLSSIAD